MIKKINILTYEYTLIAEPGYSENKKGDNPDKYLATLDAVRKEIKYDPDHPEAVGGVFHELGLGKWSINHEIFCNA